MEVMVVADGHYYRDLNGDVYAETTYDYNFYKRYLMTFDKVYAVVRIVDVDKVPNNWKKSSGPGVEFLELPHYRGPWEYAKIYFKLKKYAKLYANKCDCAIFRLPAATANFMCKAYVKTQKKFAVEIVVDPWENFAPGSIKSVLRPIIRWSWTKIVRDMCLKADGASYVTEHYLQSKYPISNTQTQFTSYYSSVELGNDSFAKPRNYIDKSTWYISHVANTFNDYGKGHIPLMRAIQRVNEKGYDARIVFIGDGPKRAEFESYAHKLGLKEKVEFVGRLPSSVTVREQMKNTDIFVFPTKAEGLPRALLEAMAEGLPCISSPTCGIPEVLGSEYLCEYDDFEAFAEKIMSFISNPELMNRESANNLEMSKKFAASVLNSRRKRFYDELRNRVQK